MSTLYTFAHPGDGTTPSTILNSTDGVTWSTLAGSSSNDFNGNNLSADQESLIVTLNGITFYYKVLEGVGMVYSQNGGTTWTSLNSILTNIKSTSSYVSIVYNGNYILFAGFENDNLFGTNNLYVAKSSNGVTWSEYLVSDSNNSSTSNIKLYWNGTKWLMAGRYNDNGIFNIFVIQSTNEGITWTNKTVLYIGGIVRGLSYFSNNWILLAGSSLVYTTDPTSTWNQSIGAIDNYSLSLIDNLLVIYRYISGTIKTTTDLINWTTYDISIPPFPISSGTMNINKVAGKYVMSLDNYMTSPNTSYLGYADTLNSWTFSSGNNTTQQRISMFSFNLNEPPPVVPCLVQGMEVNTENGPRKVEDIKVGDIVLDILNRKFKVTQFLSKKVIGNKQNIPYIIPKDYFEKDIPINDIYISYNHAYFYNGKWRLPIHDDNLKQDESLLGKEITYYHIALPNYVSDKLVCYNLPVDSFDISKYNQENMI